MPDIPAKPQSIIIEKWLPYEPHKRSVIFQRSPPLRNEIIQVNGVPAEQLNSKDLEVAVRLFKSHNIKKNGKPDVYARNYTKIYEREGF